MSVPSRRRPGRLVVVIVVALCVSLAGGIGGWLYARSSDGTDPCSELSGDKRIRSVLEPGEHDGASCSRLGSAIRRATTGEKAGGHSLSQAQAMKNVVLALDDVTRNGAGHLDPALAVPVSKALADYMPDVYQIVAPGNVEYVRAERDAEPPWQDDDGVHMSVFSTALLHVMRELADSPPAYAQLRDAASRHAAESFASVPRSAEDWRFESPTRAAAYVLGALDAVADDVRKGSGEDNWKDWSTEVFDRLTKTSSTLPAYEDDPAGHIQISWQQTLHATGQKDLLPGLEGQATGMTEVWGKAAGLDTELRKSLLEVARDNSDLGLQSTQRDLS
ncbi:hypothetical protein [Streptomyces sp. YIM S03343]